MKKNWMPLALYVGGMLLFAACQEPPTAHPEAEYKVLTVTTSDKVLTSTYSATIRGRQDIDIYPQISGTLTRLCVSEGDEVHKGQVLFVIDQVPFQAALNTAVANVQAAKAGVATAQLNYESAKAQYEEASLAFQQTVLNAGAEVNEALVACQTSRKKSEVVSAQVASLQRAYETTSLLMKHGNTNYLEVLTARQALLGAQLQQSAVRLIHIQSVIRLYLALGGSCE